MNLYVYYDDSYMTSWVTDDLSLVIADFFRRKGFRVVDAEELKEIMENSVDEDTCWKDLIIFSRDVMPETICHLSWPSALVRNYLDCGGTIVWFGDIPFYYRGRSPSLSETLKEQLNKANPSDSEKILKQDARDEKERFAKISNMRGCFDVLEAVPVFLEHPASKVRINRTGKKLGLNSSWYSNRPILIRGSNLRKKKPVTLATSKPRYMMPFERSVLGDKKERKLSPNVIDLLSKILGLIPALIAAVTALYLLWAGFATTLIWSFLGASAILSLAYIAYWLFWSRATYAGAWFKNFDERHPDSGFYRLWDFRPHRMTANNLEELHTVTMTIIERNSRGIT
jgi:hypothetical protein